MAGIVPTIYRKLRHIPDKIVWNRVALSVHCCCWVKATVLAHHGLDHWAAKYWHSPALLHLDDLAEDGPLHHWLQQGVVVYPVGGVCIIIGDKAYDHHLLLGQAQHGHHRLQPPPRPAWPCCGGSTTLIRPRLLQGWFSTLCSPRASSSAQGLSKASLSTLGSSRAG